MRHAAAQSAEQRALAGCLLAQANYSGVLELDGRLAGLAAHRDYRYPYPYPYRYPYPYPYPYPSPTPTPTLYLTQASLLSKPASAGRHHAGYPSGLLYPSY